MVTGRTRLRLRPWLALLALTAIASGGLVSPVAAETPAATADVDPVAHGDSLAHEGTRADAANVTDSPVCLERVQSAGSAADALESSSQRDPHIVELYPNPTTHGNVGEYVALEVPPETSLANWTITDGHTTARFPNETVSGTVAATTDAEETSRLTDHSTVELEGTIRLAADGDDIDVRDGDGESIDAVAYDDAPLAERWHRLEAVEDVETGAAATVDPHEQGVWVPQDGTCVPVSSADAGEATAFVLPDSPSIPRETIRDADDRLLLGGYTITAETVADDLIAAADRGVEVAVLLESGPVGGTPETSEPVLERLVDAGVEVRALGGEGARYRFHHPKYAVADDTVLVTSENWKPGGVGGQSSRGWGVRVTDEALAEDLAAVFHADFDGWDTRSGDEFLETATFVEEQGNAPPWEDDAADRREDRQFPTEHDAATVSVEQVDLLVAPDNAEQATLEYIAGADDEILVKQASIAPDATVLAETVEAARRGVDVRILLDSTWYHEDENDALRADLERTADREDLPLEVALVEETDRFEKIHAKGVIVDREVALVGSANWNQNAFENNREVLLAVHGEEPATFYADVFEADWDGEGEPSPWSIPVTLVLAVILALAIAALIGHRYLRFGDERIVDPTLHAGSDDGTALESDASVGVGHGPRPEPIPDDAPPRGRRSRTVASGHRPREASAREDPVTTTAEFPGRFVPATRQSDAGERDSETDGADGRTETGTEDDTGGRTEP
ncbi:hypothetical protein B1756_01755 [Natrarchaeobaculum aegyptiacum]|uniref:PLD phosphodiesterase domain-containing protein n=1 Tax=Natrarchaeobaculum aegyptiacum TaxID=745377 RepID=A0A2Z2HNR2_9EURY|nr:hypothetical protein B1756_01755 [Natrarchaeobaculum aegyptiacum]